MFGHDWLFRRMGPKPWKFIGLRSSYVDFQTQSGHDMIHGEKNGLPICQMQNNPAPFALPSSRAVSFAWKFRPSWSWWLCSFLKRMPGGDVCGTMLPFNISHHNNLQGQWSNKYPLAHFQRWGQHFETFLSFSGFCRHNVQLHCPTAQGEITTSWPPKQNEVYAQHTKKTQTPT